MKRSNGITLKRKNESTCRIYICKGCKQEKKYYSHFAPNYCGKCLRSGA